MRIKILSAISFLVVWLCMVGISFEPLSIIFMLSIPLITFLISMKLNLLPGKNFFSLKVFSYIIWLLKEIVISTIGVIKLAWQPHIKIVPVIEPIKSIQKSDEGLVLYANSITLTPGTVTLNTIDGALLVHALDVSMIEDLKEGEMDRRIDAVINSVN